MNTTYHHIRRLYLEKLTGTISEEEDYELQKLLDSDADVRIVWEELEQERRKLDVDEVLAQVDPEEELANWNKQSEEVEEEPVTRSIGAWKWMAAAVFVAVGISYFYNSNFKERELERTAAVTDSTDFSERIKLILADGKSVTFSKDSVEKYSIAGIQLATSANQLEYQGDENSKQELNTLEVPATQDYSIVLSDGTKVYLNSASKLRFPFYFSGNKREVFIEGEAYLEVAKDAGKSFVVHTPLTDIQVLGTRFNVNTYRDNTVRTSLLEGSVALRAAGRDSVRLVPGQEAVYLNGKGFTADKFDESELLSWRDGVFYFQNEQLQELSAIITRWYGVEVTFERKSTAQYAVSGMLEKGHLEDFLTDLQKTSGINYSLNGSRLIFK